jgi:NAD(P)-dependent dehydrogenase (short-subunit alcohol dehydrogenase family)
VIVTGGNSGTGYATCLTLYNSGATVYMASRSPSKAKEAILNIRNGKSLGSGGILVDPTESESNSRNKKGTITFLELDLADLDSVERFVDEFKRKEDRLDLLFANAGVMASYVFYFLFGLRGVADGCRPQGLYTKQGYTLQFGTNVCLLYITYRESGLTCR